MRRYRLYKQVYAMRRYPLNKQVYAMRRYPLNKHVYAMRRYPLNKHLNHKWCVDATNTLSSEQKHQTLTVSIYHKYILWLCAYLMKVIPEKRCAHYVFNTNLSSQKTPQSSIAILCHNYARHSSLSSKHIYHQQRAMP